MPHVSNELIWKEMVFSGILVHPGALSSSGLAAQCDMAQVPWTGHLYTNFVL